MNFHMCECRYICNVGSTRVYEQQISLTQAMVYIVISVALLLWNLLDHLERKTYKTAVYFLHARFDPGLKL